jgi:hypothetical protein
MANAPQAVEWTLVCAALGTPAPGPAFRRGVGAARSRLLR